METVTDAPKGKEVKLPSGKTAVVSDFKGKHIKEAQKIAGDNAGNVIFAIIAITTEIDGKPVLMEDMDEMDGWDCMALMTAFGTNFTPAPSK